MNVLRMADQDLRGKRVLIREDLNVPVEHGKVTSDARIRASLPTIKLALDKGAKVFVTSHLGRPEEGVYAEEFSLAPVASRLSELLGTPVLLKKDWLNTGVDTAPGSAVLLENVRFNKGEKKDKEELAKKMADLCDVYVMDAFGTAHRAEASTHGVGKFAKVACAGPLLVGELEALERALAKPARPLVAIVAGSKVSTKLTVLESLLAKVDKLIVGGGIANTFLAATGINVGKSLHEAEMLDMAQAAGAGQGAWRRDPAAHRRGGGQGIRGHGARRHPFDPRRASRRDDPRHRPGHGGALRRDAAEGRHHHLERPGGCVRVRPVRRGHQGHRAGDRAVAGVLAGRRR